ncbi:MAG: LuxR C-terminal-related transcriptional regulator [Phycisphaerales bacterium]
MVQSTLVTVTRGDGVGVFVSTTLSNAAPVRAGAPSSDCVSKDALRALSNLPGVACVLRDENLVLVWCNEAYARLSKRNVSELVGTKMEAFISQPAAEERSDTMRRVMNTRQPEQFFQCGADQRLLCGLFPIDQASFGHDGILITVQSATGVEGVGRDTSEIPVLKTPCFDGLDVLSPAELRVLHHLATGRSTAQIGERLSRSAKTIEKQIESIHRKLKTGSRAELVRLAVERGLQAFKDSDWDQIIEGARVVRRSGSLPSVSLN